MASTVNSAFSEFLTNTVNPSSYDADRAKSSRDYLIENITTFSGDSDFFNVFTERNLKYGSFARHTKIKPLDDIDIMICFSALNNDARRTYSDSYDCVYIEGIPFDDSNHLLTPQTNHLNSTKVINRLIAKLSSVKNYSKAEMHKNHEAATLQLSSYPWNFDIVPSFYTDTGIYLIPDGNGNWKKTDPRIDNDRTERINQFHKGKILDVIRLMKYWNNRRVTVKIGSYMLECMILSVYENMESKDNYWVDIEFKNTLSFLSNDILKDVPDPKGIQGNLNMLSITDRFKISDALQDAYKKAVEASNYEINDKDQAKAISKWKDIFGPEFPSYSV